MYRVTDFPADVETDKSPSRTVRALLAIRELILEGALAPRSRISELSVAERTGISRTPIRAALQKLEEEGLVETIPSGGFAVKSFSQQDVFDAIEIRGALEGLAARLAAERGSAARLGPLQACLQQLDQLVGLGIHTEEGFAGYVSTNARFHALVVDLAESPTLKFCISLANLKWLIGRPCGGNLGIKIDPTDPCIFQLSGGTTGIPKLIPRTHNDYAFNSKSAAAVSLRPHAHSSPTLSAPARIRSICASRTGPSSRASTAAAASPSDPAAPTSPGSSPNRSRSPAAFWS